MVVLDFWLIIFPSPTLFMRVNGENSLNTEVS